MDSLECSERLFATKRSDNSKRHLKNVHGVGKNTIVPRQLGDGLPIRQPKSEPEDGLYTKEDDIEDVNFLHTFIFQSWLTEYGSFLKN